MSGALIKFRAVLVALAFATLVVAPPQTLGAGLSRTAVAAKDPCAPSGGSVGTRIIESFQCAGAKVWLSAQCAVSVATIILPAFKALKIAKTTRDLYEINKIHGRVPKLIARILNKIKSVGYNKNAPPGYRSPSEVDARLGEIRSASDGIKFLVNLSQAISQRDYQTIARLLVSALGLDVCVKSLGLDQLPVMSTTGTIKIVVYAWAFPCGDASNMACPITGPLSGATVAVSGLVPPAPGSPVYCSQRQVVTDSQGVALFTGCTPAVYQFPMITKSGWYFGPPRTYEVGLVRAGRTVVVNELMQPCRASCLP